LRRADEFKADRLLLFVLIYLGSVLSPSIRAEATCDGAFKNEIDFEKSTMYRYYSENAVALFAEAGIFSKPSFLEFEASKDMLKGLSLRAEFSNGKSLAVVPGPAKGSDSPLVRELRRGKTLAKYTLLPDALKKLGDLLGQVCRRLGKSGCEVYANYKGTTDLSPRPLTPWQEKSVKWAIVYALPGIAFETVVKRLTEREGVTPGWATLAKLYRVSLKGAIGEEYLKDAFSDDEAETIIREVADPFIIDTFSKLRSRFRTDLN